MNGTFNLRDNISDLAFLASPFVLWWMWFRFKSYRASAWPRVTGRIESGEVAVIRGKGGESATATIAYSYRANGTFYSGYHKEYFGDEQKAWDYVDSARGRTIQVRYKPRNPEKSMLRAEDQIGS